MHLTHLGGKFREFFLSRCGEEKISVYCTDSGSDIRFCYTLLNREKQTTTEIVEEAAPVAGTTEQQIYALFEKWLPGAGMVVISGSKAPGYSDKLFPDFTKQAKAQNKVVVLDLRGEDLHNSLVYCPDIIKPNYTEFTATFYTEPAARESEQDDALLPLVKKKMESFYNDYGTKTVLTRGKFPVLYYDGTDCKEAPVIRCDHPQNTTGCGDAFTAGLAAALFHGQTLADAVKQGHECAWTKMQTLRPGFFCT